MVVIPSANSSIDCTTFYRVVMRNLVICFALLTGCAVISAQMYRSDEPFHPFPARFPSRVSNIKNQYTPLILDSHVECIRQLKATNNQLVETNEIVQTVKNDLMEEISKLKIELESIKNSKGNADIEELKIQLADTKETVDILVDQMAENSLLLIDSMVAISSLDAQFADIAGNSTKNFEEINVGMGELREQIKAINESSSTLSSSKIDYLEMELNATKEQSAIHSNLFNVMTQNYEVANDQIVDLRIDLNANKDNMMEVKDKVKKLTAALRESMSPSSIGKMPTSCVDLKQIGHVKSGLYSVMGNNSVQNVYCDFTLAKTNEKLIGEADVKSTPTYFSVQRTSPFTKEDTPIPFDIALVNTGKAMNLSSGIFTAPVAGIYSFSFHGLVEFQATQSAIPFLAVGLFVNNERVALALNEESNTRMINNKGQRSPLSLTTTIVLQKGDQVWLDVFAKSGVISLYDNANKHTDFTGWLVHEYLVSQ